MLRTIVVFVLFCFLKQNYAFVLRTNAELNELTPGIEDSSINDNHVFGRRSEESFLSESSFGTQSNANGLQAEFDYAFNTPFASGHIMHRRQVGDEYKPQFLSNGAVTDTNNQNAPKFETHSFELSPEYKHLYIERKQGNEEQIPPPGEGTVNGAPPPGIQSNLHLNDPQTGLPTNENSMQHSGQHSAQTTMPTGQQLPSEQQMMQQSMQTTQPAQLPQNGQIPSQQQFPQPSMENAQPSFNPQSSFNPQPSFNPNYSNLASQSNLQHAPTNPLYPTQNTPSTGAAPGSIKMSAAGASSSMQASWSNNQPPRVAESASAYNINYDPSRPNPMNGGYAAATGYSPNYWDPNQGTYKVTQGSIPSQGNPTWQSNGQYIPQNLNPTQQNTPSLPQLQQAIQYLNSVTGQKIIDPNILNNIQQMNGFGLPINPLSITAPLQQFAQSFPRLLQNTIFQGLQLAKLPVDMLDAALQTFDNGLGNIHFNEFAQVPARGGRAFVNTIQQAMNELQKTVQPQTQSSLVRRSPQPWMFPTLDFSEYYKSIPVATAQGKITDMKSSIMNRFQTPSFPQPSISQSTNGEPVVKMSSTSVSESTHSSSVNGGPTKVSHQATGSDFNYDSTNTENPIQSDFVALQGSTPDINDPTKGNFVAFENIYPQNIAN